MRVVAGRRGTVLDGGRVLFGGPAGPVVGADRAGVSAAEPEAAATGFGPRYPVLPYPAAAGAGPPDGWRVTAVDTAVTGTGRCSG